ncbi:PadR family transcriptional regulator [candidate division KSB1 bacterium]
MYLFSKQEELIMLSVFDLKDKATLSGIRKNLVQNAGKDWAIGSIYVALSRLIRNGYVRSQFGEPTRERGGKAQKYFSLTTEGIEQLKETKKLQDNIWKNFSKIVPE